MICTKAGLREPDLWVIIPAYQEASAMVKTVAGLHRYASHIVVIDDGSTDGTGVAARGSGASVVTHVVNLGQGAALQTGLDYALLRGAQYICTFDADGQHDPSTLPLMLETLRATGADVALGTRYLGGTIGTTRARRWLLRAAVAFTRFHTRLPVTDTHNGLRMFTRRAAAKIRINQAGMAHGSELLSCIVKLQLTLTEVPTLVTYTEYSTRKGQKLSNSMKIVWDLMYAALCR